MFDLTQSFRFILIGLLAINLCHISNLSPSFVGATNEDPLEDEATVENDDKPAAPETPTPDQQTALTEQDQAGGEEMPDGLPKPHPSIAARLLFTDPPGLGIVPRSSSIVPLEVPVGRPVRVLVAFKHTGTGGEKPVKEFTLDGVAGALRYPSDYSYYIQNFTALRLDRVVEAEREATISYAFMPALQLSSRPYGLTIRVFYHDTEGQTYVQTVMNETVQLIEWESPNTNRWVDTEAIFMYLVVLCVLALGCLTFYHLWQSYAPKKFRSHKKVFSSQTSGSSKFQSSPGSAGSDSVEDVAMQAALADARAKGVNVDWIPKEHLVRKGVRQSPRETVKQRKQRRDVGSTEESE